MSGEAPDRRERERALDPGTSFIVQAPAGSGKTELLIQRYLVLLARVERPEEIVAITFTRKAAAEMRKRILDALAAARGPRPDDEPHRARTWDLAKLALAENDRRNWKLEENAARLRVQTIDALNVSLTRRMPIVSGFGAQPETIDDATAHYFEAARNLLLSVETADPDEDKALDIARLLEHLDNNPQTALALIADLLASRDHWIRTLREFPSTRQSIEAALVRVREGAAARCRELYPQAAAQTLEHWQALAKSLLTQEGTWRKGNALAQSLSENEPLRIAFEEARDAPPPCFSDEQWEALEAITNLLPKALAQLKVVFAAHGQCDFVEIALGALNALGDVDGPSDLLLALDYRIRHILVDEFQDTSRSQYELLARLTEGWEAGDGRTLFVVGDPMQSIYRFRQAEVGLFLDARRTGLGTVRLEPLTLSANFRSQPSIVGWVNDAFGRILPAQEDIAAGAVSYSPSVAMPSPSAGPEVKVHPFFDGDRAGEASCVVDLVKAAREQDPRGTVGILVRARTQLLDIVPGLRAAGLRFRAVEIELLSMRPAVQDLLALVRALSHLADRTAWLSVLRAPWCGLELADLCKLGDRGIVWDALHDDAKLASMSDAGRARLVRTRDILAHALDQRLRASLRDSVEGAWLALGGPACLESATELEDATIFLDFLEAQEEAGAIADPAAFERSLEKLYAIPDLEADETLQVMTVHKAKGLEFDTVIVPGLGAGTDREDRKLFLWLKRRDLANELDEFLMAPMNPTGSDEDGIYEYIRAIDKVHAEHESGRLMYVAATRARTALHLCGDARITKKGPSPGGGSLLRRLWPVVESVFVPKPGAPAQGEGGRVAPAPHLLRRVTMPVAEFALPPAAAWNAPPEETAPQDLEFSWAGETARRIGSVAHRWLQRIADEGLEHWNAEKVRSLAKVLRANLAAAGVGAADVEAAAQGVEQALVNALEDERGRWILGAHPEAHNEHRLTSHVDGVRRQLVIDRHFVDADGTRWVVDYKTSRHEGADPEGFLDRERERYRPQLARYAALFDTPSRQGLYFPLLPGWRDCNEEAAGRR